MPSLRFVTKSLLVFLGAASVVHAHSWVEELRVIAPNGTMVGEPGYPRGNVKRNEAGFGDPALVHLVTGAPNDLMCKASQKSPASQSASSPRLKAAPGDAVAVRYQENGHVTLPDAQAGKAKNRGDIYVYGTTQPKDNEMLNDVHGVWTADGKGGDGRGVLLAKRPYDDGQCYQINGGPISTQRQKQFAHAPNPLMGADLWCQSDIKIPSTAPSGQLYTLYWVWIWDTQPDVDPNIKEGKPERYTSCIDVDLSEKVEFAQLAASAGFVQGQPIENAAVPEQFAQLNEQADAPAPAPSAPASSAPAPAPSAPDPPVPGAAGSATPSLVPPFAAPTVSPIPAPDAPSASAPSAPAPGAAETQIAPIPPLGIQFATANSANLQGSQTTLASVPRLTRSGSENASPTAGPVATVTVTESAVTITETVVTATQWITMPVQSPGGPAPSAPPQIRGRNWLFHRDV